MNGLNDFREGVVMPTASKTQQKSGRSKKRRNVGKSRAERLLLEELDFIHNSEFEKSATEDAVLACSSRGALPEEVATARKPRRPSDVPAYFAHLYETPLLTPEQERRAFKRMNYAKFRANAARSGLDPEAVDLDLVREAEFWLRIGMETRDAIVQANLRLVVSIARRFANGRDSFDDLVSEGNVVLMQAVAKFDYGRGFRFSTYATHAIQRTFYRRVAKSQKQSQRFVTGSQEYLSETAEDAEPDDVPANSQIIRTILEHAPAELDDREQAILSARFGLSRGEGVETLQVLADKLGVCKERVRQLQIRAVDKLRSLADRLGVSPEFGTDAAV